MVKNLSAMQRSRFDPWDRKITWRREWQPTPVFLPEEFHGQRSLVGYCPWDHRVRHDGVTNTNAHLIQTKPLMAEGEP